MTPPLLALLGLVGFLILAVVVAVVLLADQLDMKRDIAEDGETARGSCRPPSSGAARGARQRHPSHPKP